MIPSLTAQATVNAAPGSSSQAAIASQQSHAGLTEHPTPLAVMERLPAYAPAINPVEGLWYSLKAIELANLASPSLWPRSPAGPIAVSSVYAAPRLWPIRSFAMPAVALMIHQSAYSSPFR